MSTYGVYSAHWVYRFGGMERWNGTVEWNSGMVEWWNAQQFYDSDHAHHASR